MTYDPLDKPKGLPLLVFIAGLAAAAALTLVAAVGTSMLHRQAPEETKSSAGSPVARQGTSGAASISRSAPTSDL